jgi:ribosomal protein L29
MTSKEIRELSPPRSTTKLRETREQLLQLRLRKHTGQVEKPHLLRALPQGHRPPRDHPPPAEKKKPRRRLTHFRFSPPDFRFA